MEERIIKDINDLLIQLFQKMKEAGYEWDDEKKELKEITMKYIDLGLPSGTLWADTNEEGFFAFDEAVEKCGDNLPTKEQLEELVNHCKWSWNGSGYNVTGPNGNSIILPAEGNRSCGGSVGGVGSYGDYWSSTLFGSDYTWNLRFYSGGRVVSGCRRCYGESVRLVKNK